MTLQEFLDKAEADFQHLNNDYWYRRVGGNWIVYDGNQAVYETAFVADMIQWLRVRKIRAEYRPLTIVRVSQSEKTMTLAEYMNPRMFPLTTQVGLSPENQLMLDAINYDAVREDEQNNVPFNPDEAATAAELRAKYAAMPEVAAELKQQLQAHRPR